MKVRQLRSFNGSPGTSTCQLTRHLLTASSGVILIEVWNFLVTSVIMELVVKFLYRFLNINIPGISQSMELTTAKYSFRSNFTLIISYDRSVFQCWDLASNKVFWNVSMTGY